MMMSELAALVEAEGRLEDRGLFIPHERPRALVNRFGAGYAAQDRGQYVLYYDNDDAAEVVESFVGLITDEDFRMDIEDAFGLEPSVAPLDDLARKRAEKHEAEQRQEAALLREAEVSSKRNMSDEAWQRVLDARAEFFS